MERTGGKCLSEKEINHTIECLGGSLSKNKNINKKYNNIYKIKIK